MEAVTVNESTSKDGKLTGKSPAKIMSRGDLSKANPAEARAKLNDLPEVLKPYFDKNKTCELGE
jgi:hypothetical protein